MSQTEKLYSQDGRLEFDADDDCVHWDAYGKPYVIQNMDGSQRRIPLYPPRDLD